MDGVDGEESGADEAQGRASVVINDGNLSEEVIGLLSSIATSDVSNYAEVWTF